MKAIKALARNALEEPEQQDRQGVSIQYHNCIFIHHHHKEAVNQDEPEPVDTNAKKQQGTQVTTQIDS
ncbi:hypothetical protein [Aeromonas hydrophila]|uniref:hypothetical protein n=1 Tax=Aeromonas hydrophila TaxID=644 RepID=UPI00126A2538|nr:hypothetical protein [Aeromonas hydrophila]